MAVRRNYSLRVTNDAAELLRSLHPEIKRKIKAAFKSIVASPAAGKALRDELAGMRSFRVARFRIIYKVTSHSVEVVALGPCKRIYEETYRLLKKGR